MKSITLKEIAGYLPYGLTFKWESVQYPNPVIVGYYNGMAYFNFYGVNLSAKLSDSKPLLYPLSMLTQPIIHEGKEIIPIVEMIKELSLFDLSKCEFELSEQDDDLYFVNAHEDGGIIDWLSFDGNLFEHERVQHECFELLNKYHIDWKYNLIEQGKAIDKSKI